MDIRQLRYFIAIAEEGSITKAAERLFMTQPPLSRELQAMEKKLGVTLVDRTNKKDIFLTPQGRILLKNARRILNDIDGAITEVQEYDQQMTKKLSIGTTIYCSEIMFSALEKFLEKYPFVVPEIHEGSVSYTMDLLKKHTVELVISAPPYDTEGFHTRELEADTCVFLASRDFNWEKDCISLEEISQIPLILLNVPDPNSLYQRILQEFQKRKLELNIAGICYDSGLLSKMVLSNLGSTIVPKSMINSMKKDLLQAIPILDEPWTTKPNLIWHNDGYMSTTLKEFIKIFE